MRGETLLANAAESQSLRLRLSLLAHAFLSGLRPQIVISSLTSKVIKFFTNKTKIWQREAKVAKKESPSYNFKNFYIFEIYSLSWFQRYLFFLEVKFYISILNKTQCSETWWRVSSNFISIISSLRQIFYHFEFSLLFLFFSFKSDPF